MQPIARATAFCVAVVSLLASASGASQSIEIVPAVEFYHAGLGHYFISASPPEIAALDAGGFGGWQRTGYTFNVIPSTAPTPAGASPVCRFYGLPSAGLNSHFYSASPEECGQVASEFWQSWKLESANVFQVYLPNKATGACPEHTEPVYRAWNRRPDSNHRYTTSAAVQGAMLGQGYAAEGYGPTAVAMCAPVVEAVNPPVGSAFGCSVTASNHAPTVGQTIVLTASCTEAPKSFAWTGCSSTTNACTTTAASAKTASYSVTAWGAYGSGSATATVSWQAGTQLAMDLPPRQSAWQLNVVNPILRGGDLMDKSLWNDPSVMKIGSNYVMYATSSTSNPFAPPVLPFRAVSTDGVSWRLDPPAPLMDASGTPFVSIETPSVVIFKGQYHMYYTGVHPAGHVPSMEIGHAVSQDGIHWVKDPKPVIVSSGIVTEWTGYSVNEPGAIVFNDKIYVYFTALGARPGGSPPQLQNIGLAISADGRTFDAPRIALAQTKAYPPEAGFPGYSTPSALVDGTTIHLFYDVVHFQKNAQPQWRQVALQHAVSVDGGMTFVEDNGAFLRREDSAWTQNGEVGAPAAIIDGDTVKLWFGGHGSYDELGNMINRGWKGPEFGIGMMTTSLSRLRDSRNQ